MNDDCELHPAERELRDWAAQKRQEVELEKEHKRGMIAGLKYAMNIQSLSAWHQSVLNKIGSLEQEIRNL